MTHNLDWWLLALLLGAIGWQMLGIALASWRQRGDDSFLIAMILWSAAPFWVWFVPFSRELRLLVISFWRGMDWVPHE